MDCCPWWSVEGQGKLLIPIQFSPLSPLAAVVHTHCLIVLTGTPGCCCRRMFFMETHFEGPFRSQHQASCPTGRQQAEEDLLDLFLNGFSLNPAAVIKETQPSCSQVLESGCQG